VIHLLWLPAAIAFLLWFLPWLRITAARWNPPELASLPADGALPRLTIIVAACNEEADIEAAMKTLLALDYPDLEIVAVDDRSTDATGAILDRLADARLRVVHVKELPPGWLGKTHALHLGASQSTGAFILFTDADVRFEPSALRRAVRHAESAKLDMLSVFADVDTGGFLEGAVVGFFSIGFSMHTRPWLVRNPKSDAHVGIGAFNLVRAEAYRRMGGHAKLALEVVDDVKLGQRMKASGAVCDVVASGGAVRVRWVQGVGGFVRGTAKNFYAGFGFRPTRLLAVVTGVLVMTLWPWIGVWFGPPGPRILSGAAILAMAVAGTATPVGPRLQGLLYPFAGLVMCWSALRSMILTHVRGGVEWRGTLYRLEELRNATR
jgi:cellulose synthase/poly-beta-1,6-N-acetylglucosamine synthase-like glycosyltransferase